MPENISDLKNKFNLAEIVSRSTLLKPSGAGGYIALCPFHAENTPSFRVDNLRFHCFGCGVSGDIFNWYKLAENLDFKQTFEKLTGRDLPKGSLLSQKAEPTFTPYFADDIYDICSINLAAHDYFLGNIPDPIREIIKERSCNTNCELGYAPQHWGLIEQLKKDGFTQENIINASLGVLDERGNLYPRLRDRITIPLFTNNGKNILGFAGRALTNDTKTKYLLPSTTKAFCKKNYLYGTIRSNPPFVTIVEGYFDSIRLSSLGHFNVVAILGSSISDAQVRIIESYTDKVVVMMDGDLPGLNALVQIANALKRTNIKAQAVLLPDGLDPDDFYKEKRDVRPVRIHLADFMVARISFEASMKHYDREKLDKAVQPFVDSNLAEGLGHYNVVDWVIHAWPQYAEEIKAAQRLLRDDAIALPNGTYEFKDEHIRAFIRAWKKPCKAVREAQTLTRRKISG